MRITDVYEHFLRTKWPSGFSCPRCGCRAAYVIESRRQPLYQCRSCRYQASLTVGTVLEGSRTTLSKWYVALQLMARPTGVNAVQLHTAISVTYKTAWSMLRRVRMAISNFDSNQQITGHVAVHPVFYGYSFRNLSYRHPREQPCFVAMTLNNYNSSSSRLLEHSELLNNNTESRDGSNFMSSSYFKMKVISRVFLNNRKLPHVLLPMLLKKHVDIRADQCRVVGGADADACEHNELLGWGQSARQWVNDVYHGIGPKYLQSYWDEFAYRRNVQADRAHFFTHLCKVCLT